MDDVSHGWICAATNRVPAVPVCGRLTDVLGELGRARQLDNFSDERLAGQIARMSFAGDDQLRRPLGIRQQTQQSRRIVE